MSQQQAQLVNCKKCGALFVKSGNRDICDNCYKEEVKETAKKAPAKKAPAKKAPAKTTTAKKEVVTETYIQYAGQETLTSEILAKVKAAYVAEGHKESAIKSVKLYVKPEDSAVYYVINEKAVGVVSLF